MPDFPSDMANRIRFPFRSVHSSSLTVVISSQEYPSRLYCKIAFSLAVFPASGQYGAIRIRSASFLFVLLFSCRFIKPPPCLFCQQQLFLLYFSLQRFRYAFSIRPNSSSCKGRSSSSISSRRSPLLRFRQPRKAPSSPHPRKTEE